MATACLNSVSAALNTPAATAIILEHFRTAGKADKQAATTEYAPAALNRLRETFKLEHSIPIGKLSDDEIATIIEGVQTKDGSKVTLKEYQEMMEKVVKYAALRARRPGRTRFLLGVACSAASAVAITAATAAASAGVLVAAAPVGAAVGAIAVGASSFGSTQRDKKRASRHTAPVSAASAPEITAAADNSPAATEAVEGTPAPVTTPPADPQDAPVAPPSAAEGTPAAALFSPPSPRSDELVSAVVEVSPAAGPTAATPTKQTPFSAVTQIPLPANSTDSELAAAPAEAISADADEAALPELLLSPSPERPASYAAEDSVQELLTPAVSLDVARSGDLPPLAKKKKSSPSKKLKKSLSKGYKNFKKAMSISSSSDLDAAAAAAVARADKNTASTPFAGKPPSGFSFRRSFSKDSAKDLNVDDLTVQASEGSATLKKMKELLRRSFTLSTPRNSVDINNSSTRAHAF